MRIAVIGATGTAGSPTVAALKTKGHEVVEVSRSNGVDLLSGDGLSRALTGADVVIDTSFPVPPDESMSMGEAVTTAAANVVEACAAQQVGHLVALSIIGIDHPGLADFDYYVAKGAQERIVDAGAVPSTLVKTTQWHEFATNPAAVDDSVDEVRVQNWLIQPIAVDAVAEVLVETALDAPAAGVESETAVRLVTGPEVIRLPELTSAYLEQTGDDRPVTTVDAALTAMSDGTLLAPADAEVRGPGLDDWLHSLS